MRRIAKGCLAIALGMNTVAFGMKLNGSNYAGNLAWDIVSAYLTLQFWIIALAVFAAITFTIVKNVFSEKENKESVEEMPQIQPTCHLETLKAQREDIQPPKEIPKDVPTKTSEPPKPLGKEDLKKRVLQELTGRSDI